MMSNQALFQRVARFVGEIEWAWNTRNAAALCALYTDDADIIHSRGAAHGKSGIGNLYQTICRNGEHMGYMNAFHLTLTFKSRTSGGKQMVGATVLSAFLNPELTQVVHAKTTLILTMRDGQMRITRDIEQLV